MMSRWLIRLPPPDEGGTSDGPEREDETDNNDHRPNDNQLDERMEEESPGEMSGSATIWSPSTEFITTPYTDKDGLMRVGRQPLRHQLMVSLAPRITGVATYKKAITYMRTDYVAMSGEQWNGQTHATRQKEELLRFLERSSNARPTGQISRVCDYTGVDLSWYPGPRSTSIEAVNPVAIWSSGMGYHVVPNVAVVSSSLNLAKKNHGLLYLPLAALWIRTIDRNDLSFSDKKGRCAWIYNAMCNCAIMATCCRLTRDREIQFKEWREWSLDDLRGFVDALRTGKKTESIRKTIDSFIQADRKDRKKVLAPESASIQDATESEKQDGRRMLEGMIKIADTQGLSKEDFIFYLTIRAPRRSDRVFFPFHLFSHARARELRWDWNTTIAFAKSKITRMKGYCNKRAEDAGIGEKELSPTSFLYTMAAHFSQKFVRLRSERPDARREELLLYNLDRFGMLLVPWQNHPGKLSLCKDQDHGVAMMMGFDVPDGMEFDPLQHINLRKSTITFDSVLTNISMWNYSMEDTASVRDLVSRPPLWHSF